MVFLVTCYATHRLCHKVKAIKPFSRKHRFVHTHAQGDKKSGYAFEIKPDVTVYDASIKDCTSLGCDSFQFDMFIEFKRHAKDDPFTSPSSNEPATVPSVGENNEDEDEPFSPASSDGSLSTLTSLSSDHSLDELSTGPPLDYEDALPSARVNKPFINPSSASKLILGQIGAYASAQLASQFCTHCFSVCIFKDIARIIRWDREGAVVTEPILYNVDSSLLEFFFRFSQAPSELRGVDTTVTSTSEHEAARARTKLGLPPDMPLFKTTVPRSADGVPFTIIFPQPFIIPTTPACRGTCTCATYDPLGDRKVFFKDSWRVDVDGITAEGDVYAILNKQGVPHVPNCLASRDVQCAPEQRTKMVRYSKNSWVFAGELAPTAHRHHRIVLDIVGTCLDSFSSSWELVQAVHDALIGGWLPFYDGMIQ